MRDNPYHREHRRERSNMRQNTVIHQRFPKGKRHDGRLEWCCMGHYSEAKDMKDDLEIHPAVESVSLLEQRVYVDHIDDGELDDAYERAASIGYIVNSGLQSTEDGRQYFEITGELIQE